MATISNDLTRATKVLKDLSSKVESLENNGVDLTNYPTKTEVNSGIASGVNEAKTYTDGRETAIKAAYDKAINDAITALKGVAPETLDTLEEIAKAFDNNPDIIKNLVTQMGTKASTTDLTSHTSKTDIHVTAAQKTEWSGKVSTSQLNSVTSVSDPTLSAWLTTQAGA